MIILALYFNVISFVSCNSNEIRQNSASYIDSEYKIVPYGKDAQLKCSLAGHEPKKELFWIRNDDSSKRYAIEKMDAESLKNIPIFVDRDGALNIRQVTSKDVGSYSCYVFSLEGYIHNMINLDIVNERPKIRERPVSKSAKIGQQAQFSCSVTGYPEPILTWSHNGVPINIIQQNSQFSRFTMNKVPNDLFLSSVELQIDGVIDTDSGEFSCHAQNEFGDLTGNRKTKTFYSTYGASILVTMIIYIGFQSYSYSHLDNSKSGNHTEWSKRLGCVCWM